MPFRPRFPLKYTDTLVQCILTHCGYLPYPNSININWDRVKSCVTLIHINGLCLKIHQWKAIPDITIILLWECHKIRNTAHHNPSFAVDPNGAWAPRELSGKKCACLQLLYIYWKSHFRQLYHHVYIFVYNILSEVNFTSPHACWNKRRVNKKETIQTYFFA